MMLGLVPLGLAFGVLVTQSGFAWYWAPVLSTVIYAGSMEFVALGLITAGTGLVTGAVTAVVVNFRHIFYGLTHPRVHGWAGLYTVYSLTDETYAALAAKENVSERVVAISHLLCQAAWVIPGIIGALVGSALPADLTGIDFVMPALFASLATEAYRASGTPRMVVLALAATALASWLVPAYALILALSVYALVALIPGTMGVRQPEPVIVVDHAPKEA
ncbi:branched-chain amino acid ABC transporter permease [Corynebacterium sp. 13CS0277]|nr:branched-chain amino acid ABC transporter permease [Corynebacterium sp. 13CS0277]